MYTPASQVQAAHLPPPAHQSPPPLPPGWTEHKAPTGHTYYYNKALNTSTYTRPAPIAETPAAPAVVQQQAPAFIPSYSAGQFAGGFNPAQFQAPPHHPSFDRKRDQRPPRRPDNDRPKHKYEIPGCAPWVLVKTKLGRRFVHNTKTKESLWKFPDHVMKSVVEFDRREREKQERRERGEASDIEDDAAEMAASKEVKVVPVQQADNDEDSSEYEEIEVTDSEADDGGEADVADTQRPSEGFAQTEDQGPREFTEEDMMYQLESMQQGEGGYDFEPGAYYEEEPPLSEEDANALFRDLLEDHHISPFTPWDRIIEAGHIIDDERYLALPTMKARRECFDRWSHDKIQALKEQREKQAKQDPRIPYLQLLDEHASVKLYWPEFKRKFRKEAAMKDLRLADKEKEKLYREHVKRLSMEKDVLKKDLTSLLKSVPLGKLNRGTSLSALPSEVVGDLRYISLPAKIRDAMIEAYISTLDPAPSNGEGVEDAEAEVQKRRDRERREQALRDREERVREAKRRHQRDLRYGRERLKEKEEELERAMKVGKEGLRGHFVTDEEMKDAPGE
ncbi:uncharacterized protein PV09_08964 [Verruconis gallopava]|uniref:WW domain-containing protein n=1 Tax=Verruconis gallopava TaxID=253628 RepID=A0A0D2AK17_9PEZI|nr:uncharacterized protein PV09_08964 [Verruconis gallopava]KIV99303.1 hypothetical protein PV09_08964 [Verruconis gallopava]